MGILYGIGVGPGDPEQLTLKAVRILKECDILLVPSEQSEKCYALQIIRNVIENIDAKTLVPMEFLMTKDRELLSRRYSEIAEMIANYLDEGKKLAFITIGDVTVYSTFSYIADILIKNNYQVEYVNGITSFTAVAARLKIAIGKQNEQIHIIPAAYSIEDSLKLSGTKIYMKSGKHLIELIEALRSSSAYNELEFYAVANCGMANEQVAYGLDEISSLSGYLVTVIVRSKRNY